MLAGEVTLKAAVVPWADGTLGVLPAGRARRTALPPMASRAMADWIADLAEHWDHVIIDTPAVGRDGTTPSLASFVDAALLVVNAGRTRRESAVMAKQQIERAGGRVIAAVLNRHRPAVPGWLDRWL